MKIASITVSRSGSKRVKDKWNRKIGNLSLIENKIKQLKKSSKITDVFIGTNISEVEKYCQDNDIAHIWRQEYFCDESLCSANEMIYDMCSRIDADIILWAHCTNPLVTEELYDKAIEIFLQKESEGYDSLLSVNVVQEHLWSENKTPLNFNPKAKRHTLAKELPKLYKQDGAIFIQRKQSFIDNKYFFGNRPFLFVIEDTVSIDINTEKDLKIANTLRKKQ